MKKSRKPKLFLCVGLCLMLCICGIYPVAGDNGTIYGCAGAEGVLLKFKFRGYSICTWDGSREDYESTMSYVECTSKEAIRHVDYYSKVGNLDCQDQHGVQYWRQTSNGQTVYVESEGWTLDMDLYSEGGSPLPVIYLGKAQDCYKLCVQSGLLDSENILSYPVVMRFKIWQLDPTHTIEHDYTVLEQPFRVPIAKTGTTQNYQTDYTVSLYIPLKSTTGIQDIKIQFEYLGCDGYVEVTAENEWEFRCEIGWLYFYCWVRHKTKVVIKRDMQGPTVKGSIEKTWYCRARPGFGGILVPVDKLGLLAPYIGLASTLIVATAATAIYVKRVKRREEKR